MGKGFKCTGTVFGINGCVYGMYGIPSYSKRIAKYDAINAITALVGEEADKVFRCYGGCAVARYHCIYALSNDGRVLKIDTTNNYHGCREHRRVSRTMMMVLVVVMRC